MGGHYSRPIYPVDPLFKDTGCSGFTQINLDMGTIESPPFLYIMFYCKSYDEMISTMITILKSTNPKTIATNNIPGAGLTPRMGPPINPDEANANTNEDTGTSMDFGIHFSDMLGLSEDTEPEPTDTETKKNRKRRTHAGAGLGLGPWLYGPIYMLASYDPVADRLKCYLYFPSMTIDGYPWPNYGFLSMSHRWMRRILYGPSYSFIPYTQCKRMFDRFPNGQPARTPYGFGFMYGCSIENPGDSDESCMQSDSAHRGMGIYDKNKSLDEYPNAYYHSYQLDMNDPRISRYINWKSDKNTTTMNIGVLATNLEVLPGCAYALVSPNNKYFFVLGESTIALFRNPQNIDLNKNCSQKLPLTGVVPINVIYFTGLYNTRMYIEENYLNVYSAANPTDASSLMYSVMITSPASEGPFTLVLTNEGTFQVFDKNNVDVIDPRFKNAMAKGLDGNTSINTDEYGNEIDYLGPYDAEADYRRRILNLKAYLKIRGYNVPRDDYNFDAKPDKPKTHLPKYDLLPVYDGHKDYITRYTELLRYFVARGIMPKSALIDWIDETDSSVTRAGNKVSVGHDNTKTNDKHNKNTTGKDKRKDKGKGNKKGKPPPQPTLLGNKRYVDPNESPMDRAIRLNKEDEEKATKKKELEDARTQKELNG